MSRFVQFINTADARLAVELVSSQAVFHVPGRPEPVRGPEGYLEIIGMMRGGFPDIQWTLEETVVEGDVIAARFTMRGTHSGPFFGMPPNPQDDRRAGTKHLSALEREDRFRSGSTRSIGAVAADRRDPDPALELQTRALIGGGFGVGRAS
jgi:hypothetical protein